MAPYSLETDVLISVSHILKGPADLKTIMAAELGGVQGDVRLIVKTNPLMLPGQRYVLFLVKEDRMTLPVQAGVPRYGVIAGREGKFLIEGEAIQVLTDTPSAVQRQFEGISEDEFLRAVQAALARDTTGLRSGLAKATGREAFRTP